MKIIILSPSNNVVGGVEHFCDYLKNVYRDVGYEVEIVVASKKAFIFKFFSLIGLGAPYLGWKSGMAVRKKNYDILVTNGFLGWNINRGKIINVQHGTFAASADRIDKGRNNFKWFVKKYIWGFFEKIAAQKANFVVAVSEETARSVKKYYKIKDVKVISNSVDFQIFSKKDKKLSREKFSLSNNEKLALFIGRFEYGKGSDIISNSLPKLITENCKVVVASNSEINLPGIISLKDVAYDKLPFLYSACDLFIFPSRHEGCSLSLIEAMGCEVPFLATNVGSVEEIISNDEDFSGWVSTLEDFEKKLLIRIKGVQNIEGENNFKERELAEKLFSYQNFRQKYLFLLDELLNLHK